MVASELQGSGLYNALFHWTLLVDKPWSLFVFVPCFRILRARRAKFCLLAVLHCIYPI